MYACLAVTCHLHFWQNDRDFLRATVVTRGWNGYRNKSQHRKSTLEKKILPPFQQGFEPATFQSRVRRSNHWAIPAPKPPNGLWTLLVLNTDAIDWILCTLNPSDPWKVVNWHYSGHYIIQKQQTLQKEKTALNTTHNLSHTTKRLKSHHNSPHHTAISRHHYNTSSPHHSALIHTLLSI